MKRILLIDDNDGFRRPLAEMLERAGYEVVSASDGQAALDHCDRSLDLVITDLIMPGKEGLETIIELHRRRPSLKIIAISGGGRIDPDDYLRIAQKLGATATLAKPFPFERLLRIVTDLLPEASPGTAQATPAIC